MAFRWKNDLKDCDVTDESVFLNRRRLMGGVAAGEEAGFQQPFEAVQLVRQYDQDRAEEDCSCSPAHLCALPA